MALTAGIKTTFEPSRVIQPIYTGGSASLSEDGEILATCLGDEVMLTNLHTGQHLARIEGDGEPVTTLSLSPDAQWIVVCSRSLSMRTYALKSTASGLETKLVRTLRPHATPVVTSTVDSTSALLATGGADGVIKVWEIRGGYATHTFHGHSGVTSALRFFQAGAEKNQKRNKSKERTNLHGRGNERDSQIEPNLSFRLASGSEDGKVRVWDLHSRKGIATLDAHASVVRSIHFSPEQNVLLTGSRDKTAVIWDTRTWRILSTIPVLEGIESAGFITNGRFFYTGGESARLRIWDSNSGNEITEAQEPGTETEAILDVLHFHNLPFVLSIHADQTLLLHSLEPLAATTRRPLQPLPILRRISGTHDEVIDLAYVSPERNLLALATNLEDIRLISLEPSQSSSASPSDTSSYFGADVALLKGHSDIIITLDTDWSGHWLATGAKDNIAKLWRLDPANNSYTCYATFTGHAESISAVALPNATPQISSKEYFDPLLYPPKFLITGSQDKTVKHWDIPNQAGKTPRAGWTRKAHDKDINAIEISYSSASPLFASASQDRTAKIWDVESGEAIGVLRGHKRGVWSIAFSPQGTPALTTSESGGASSAKGMAVTGSGDKTVRIWNLSDYSCLRTFEGHVNSVLKVVWLPTSAGDKSRGAQVASAAGDGLVKVWNAQAGECEATLDNHIDRVWALAVKPAPAWTNKQAKKGQAQDAQMLDAEIDDEITSESTLELVSGSADSTLTFWTDVTASTALQATTRATARIEQDQELQNHIRASNYRDAIVLALQLNHPKRLLDLFTSVVNGAHDGTSFTGKQEVDEVVGTLSDSQLWSLLCRVRDWNANGRTHNVAQHVLYAIINLYPKERLLSLRRRRRATHGLDRNADLKDAMADLDTKESGQNKESVKDVVDGLRAYTERHYERLSRTTEERFVLLWALQQMDDVGGAELGVTNGHEEDGDMMMLDNVM